MKSRIGLLLLLSVVALVVVLNVRHTPNDDLDEGGAAVRTTTGITEPPRLVGRDDREPVGGGSKGTETTAAEASGADPWVVVAKVVTTSLDPDEAWGHDPEPVTGAYIRIWLRVDDVLTEVGSAKTGADGAAVIDLGALASMSRSQLGLAHLVGQATAPGHCVGRRWFETVDVLLGEDLEPLPWAMEFRLARCAVVVGHVTTQDGSAAPYVGVRLEPMGGERPRRAFGLSDMDGRYAIPTLRSGRFRVCTGPREAPTCSEPFHVDVSRDSEAPPLRVRQEPLTPGVIRFANGDPVGHLAFKIDNPWFYEGSGWGRPPQGAWPEYDPPHDAITDENGRFQVALLHPPGGTGMEDYCLRIPGVDSMDTGFDATAPELSVLISLHRLRVRLRDGCDKPLHDQEVTLYVEGGEPDGVRGSTDGDGEVSLFAPSGSRGLLRVVTAGSAVHTRVVEIPGAGNESVVVLDVPDRTGSGQLAFAIDAPTDVEVYPVRLHVRSRDGRVVLRRDLHSASDRVELPPGVYTAELDFVPPRTSGKEAPPIRARLTTMNPNVVRDGETLTLDATWTDTAALGVIVKAAGIEGGSLPGSHVSLIGPAGERRPLPLHDRWWNERTGLQVGEWIYAARRLLPGPYRLVLEAKGFQTVIRDVLLIDRQLTRVEVEMEREP